MLSLCSGSALCPPSTLQSNEGMSGRFKTSPWQPHVPGRPVGILNAPSTGFPRVSTRARYCGILGAVLRRNNLPTISTPADTKRRECAANRRHFPVLSIRTRYPTLLPSQLRLLYESLHWQPFCDTAFVISRLFSVSHMLPILCLYSMEVELPLNFKASSLQNRSL